MYLSDKDALTFLQQAKSHLNPGGLLFVKENCCDQGFVLDRSDSSVVRSRELWLSLFEKAGLIVLQEGVQPQWPEDMQEVRMWALL